MKTPFKGILLAAVVLTVVSCGREKQKVNSHGKYYEIVVVAAPDKWDAPLGDTLREILRAPVEFINNYEPMFDVQRILPQSFNDYFTRHRNIINVTTGQQYAEARMQAIYDHYSSPQLIVNVSGPDNQSVTQYISDHRKELQSIFNIAERDRYLSFIKRPSAADKTIERTIKDRFGFDMGIPMGYMTRIDKPDFMSMTYEYPESTQGLMIYTTPFHGAPDFSLDSLLDRRDRFIANIEGGAPNSHMITYREVEPSLTHLRIKGRYWAEVRGFWEVKNDFMGGPFVTYATLDVENNKIVTIDTYVYSPSPYKSKRDLLRPLEALVHSVSFPADGAVESGTDNG